MPDAKNARPRAKRRERSGQIVLSPALEKLISQKIEAEVSKRIEGFIKGQASILIINHGSMETTLMARDVYKENTGFVGPTAGRDASHVTFNQVRQQHFADIDLQVLSGELRRLRQAMMRDALAREDDEPDHAIAIASIANAEKSAKSGDATAAFTHLKAAGKWALDTAAKVGVSVAEKAIEAALHL